MGLLTRIGDATIIDVRIHGITDTDWTRSQRHGLTEKNKEQA
jgi:hypothetical protein